jgi:hypothetical protein
MLWEFGEARQPRPEIGPLQQRLGGANGRPAGFGQSAADRDDFA